MINSIVKYVRGIVTANQGTQGTSSSPWFANLRNAAGTEVATSSNPIRVDPTGTTPQPASQSGTWSVGRTWNLSSSDLPLVSQGTAAVLGGAWPMKVTDGTNTMPTMDAAARSGIQKITDGTNTMAVKAASTPAAAADPAAVVTLSPNTVMPMINRTDVSTTVTASGNSASFDTAGMASVNVNYNISAISGTGAYIGFHIQTSDDNANWTTYFDTPRLTAAGLTRYQALRQAGRYYRYSWDVAGTTPSITFTIMTTLKPYQPLRKALRFFYADIDLTAANNASSSFSGDDCHDVSLFLIRGADGGNGASVQVYASNDSVNWVSISANVSMPVSSSNTISFSDLAWRFYQVQVKTATNAGVRTLDLQWSGN